MYKKDIRRTKNKEQILLGGIKDDFLSNVKDDNRMSLCLLIRIAPDITQKIEKCIKRDRIR